MIYFDELLRRLPSILHCLMTLLSIPYVLLAIFLVMVDKASKRGLWEMLDSFLTSFNWAMTWGCAGLAVTIFSICALGFIESLSWWGSLMLAALMGVTLSILLYYQPFNSIIDELILLAPAVLIVATCCWRMVR